MSGKPADTFPPVNPDPVKELMIDQRVDVFVETLYALCPDLLAVNIQVIRENGAPAVKTYVELTDDQLTLGSAAAFDWFQQELFRVLRGTKWKYRERPPIPRGKHRGGSNRGH